MTRVAVARSYVENTLESFLYAAPVNAVVWLDPRIPITIFFVVPDRSYVPTAADGNADVIPAKLMVVFPGIFARAIT